MSRVQQYSVMNPFEGIMDVADIYPTGSLGRVSTAFAHIGFNKSSVWVWRTNTNRQAFDLIEPNSMESLLNTIKALQVEHHEIMQRYMVSDAG